MALSRLAGLVAKFDDPDTPYRSRSIRCSCAAIRRLRHLARVKEWSLTGDADEAEGDGE